jgi:phosphatidyl-myo-inositol dimannoside synthase
MVEKKYLLFTLDFPPAIGGVATYYQDLVENWPDKNLSVLTDSGLGGTDGDRIKYRQLLSQKIKPSWIPAFFALKKELSILSSSTEVIIGEILPLGRVAYFLSKLIRFRYSVILHGLDFSMATNSKRRKKITGKILFGAEKIICANSFTANMVKAFDGNLSAKTSVANPGISPIFVRNPARVNELKQQFGLDDKIVLFSLGRLIPRKGFDKVIEAMPGVIEKSNNIAYAIGGDGPDTARLKTLAEKLPQELKSRIIFLGKISNSDYRAWLELCDIFIMPSRNIDGDYEGFGIVYLEANLAGKPVIAGDSGGVRDAVINNVNGLLVNPEDIQEISGAIIKLSKDEDLRRSLGEQGKRRTVENFNAKKSIDKFYNKLNG